MDGTPRAGDVVGDRYRLTRQLGAGGFGQVWEAHDPVLGVDVAVKRVSIATSVSDAERESILARAAREARNAARLRDHPGIVTVYDVFSWDGAPAIVMQRVKGRSLAEHLDADGAMPKARVLGVAKVLLGALDAAHREGIVHRDVKPANVMLAENGDTLLTDFGIALGGADPKLTRTSAVIGSPGYMAPERWRGMDCDGRADLFSLGVTLYEAVEGAAPFPADNPTATLTETPRPMRQAGPLAPVISGLLEKDPALRLTVDGALALMASNGAPSGSTEQTEQEEHDDGSSAPTEHIDRSSAPPTRPYTTAGASDAPVTFVTNRARAALRSVVQFGLAFGVGLAVLLGVIAFMAALAGEDPPVPGANPVVNLLAGLGLGILFGAPLGGLTGLIVGLRLALDTVTVDAEALRINHKVLRSKAGKRLISNEETTLTVRWATLQRVAIDRAWNGDPTISVWYRDENQPAEKWLHRNHVIRRNGGGYCVYAHNWDTPEAVHPERLRDAIRRFAGELYDDPDYAPEP